MMKEINIGKAAVLTSPNPLVLVCTKKEDGTLNMAPVSFFMFASFHPPMLAFAMGQKSNSGENIRRDGKAVLVTPGVTLKEAVMAYGSVSGARTDKLQEVPIALQNMAGTDIQIPEDCRTAFAVSLEETVTAGDHNLYLCKIENVAADETKEALYAWDGYKRAVSVQEKC